MRCAFWIITVLVLFAGAFQASAATIQAHLDRDSIIAGETTGLRLEVHGGNPESVAPFASIPGLTIQYRGKSQNLTSINGQSSFAIILNYAVTGTEPGVYKIPPIQVTVDGNTVSTETLQLTVTKANPKLQNRYAFLTLKVPRQEVYVGEMIPVELQLYVTSADDIQAPQLKSDGFVIHKQPPYTRAQTQVGNIMYTVLTFRMSLSAAKAGDLQLGPAEMNLTLLLRTAPDPNDPFSSFFGGNVQRRAIKINSDSFTIHVSPTPPNAPPTFTGAVGRFNWAVVANPKALNAGDPVTLKIDISGAGNLDAISLPDFDWPDFKVYNPNSNLEYSDQLGLSGVKKFEQVVVPQNSGVREIPELKWSFFDPSTKQYETLSHPAIPLQVNVAPNSQATPSGIAANASSALPQPVQKDIIHIKSSPGEFVGFTTPLPRQPWFIALQAIPILGLAGVTIWRKRQDKLANNPKLRRKIETRQYVHAGLSELKNYAETNKSEEFYALLFRLMQEQLGEKLDLPASAITEAGAEHRLTERGTSPALVQQVHALFEICNQARYAPVRTNEQLLDIQRETANVIRELENLPD